MQQKRSKRPKPTDPLIVGETPPTAAPEQDDIGEDLDRLIALLDPAMVRGAAAERERLHQRHIRQFVRLIKMMDVLTETKERREGIVMAQQIGDELVQMINKKPL